MNRIKHTARDLICLTICTLSLAAIFYFENGLYNYFATAVAIIVVGTCSLNRRENLPILMFVVAIQALELALSILPIEVMLLKYTAASLLDLLLAFFIVHYHNDRTLYNFFKVQEQIRYVPQVYLISLVLAFSSLLSFMMAAEIMFYYVDENFFQGKVPFFHSLSSPVKLTLKVLFDLAIWSLLLKPSRWKFLRKIEQRFGL